MRVRCRKQRPVSAQSWPDFSCLVGVSWLKGGADEYFAVNGVIGKSAYAAQVDFAEAADLLEHMDYLGVDRMLVEARGALEYSPILGNQKPTRTNCCAPRSPETGLCPYPRRFFMKPERWTG